MKIVIIEDEQLIAEDLMDILQKIVPDCSIIAHISSVSEGNEYFQKGGEEADLIFSDIQLGDGLSFEIFKKNKIITPTIFCTAYDEYAIDAFKANGIDYILKPYSEKSIVEAIQRFYTLQKTFLERNIENNEALQALSDIPYTKSTLLIHHREKVIPLKISEIALAYIRNESVYVRTFEGHNYVINKSLDEMENFLGTHFYRANRQFIVNRDAVKDVTTFLTRKYLVNLTFPFTEQITVSKEKMTSFLQWLKNE
ncbi:MAG TPA: LytTR family DNA-binding domain-containing protein [Taishania sp.]|nr:LytTR family DNA-binding domain-containing protein [Taishania sp.]